ncbi:putative S-adenosyl-L-methionine-dependent methyltransferase protein, partial [Corchorus capsularis]
MADEFFVGDSDSNSTSAFTELSDGDEEGRAEGEEEEESKGDGEVRIKIDKYKVCEKSKVDSIPCLDNEEAIKQFSESEKGEKYERHCPGKDNMLGCVVPRPEGYRRPIPWPQSRDE